VRVHADKRRVKEQLRLKFILPLVAVAVAGLGVAKFVLLKDDSSDAEAATPVAETLPVAPPAVAPPAETAEPAETETTEAEAPKTDVGLEKLDAALAKKKIVVVVVYSPDGAVDTLQVAEARAGATDVGAGFVALNAAKEKEIADFAGTYDVRDTPVVLVFRRGPKLTGRFDIYAHATTVAQAAQNARHANT
jgi:hypothetical protein